MGKRIITLSLAACIFLESAVYASSSTSVIDHAVSNVTPAKTFQGNNRNYYYTGGVFYKFSEDRYTQPVFNASGPSLQVGCNGLSLKGMFLSLLGLDQFGTMLQNAGTSLAWGVAVGIIYSLPGIGAVAQWINTFARDIQKLLGNACQIGQNIGKMMASDRGIDKTKINDAINNKLTSMVGANCAQGGLSCLAGAVGMDTGSNSTFSKFMDGTAFSGEDQKDNIAKAAKVFIEDLKLDSTYSFVFWDRLYSITTLKDSNGDLKSALNVSDEGIYTFDIYFTDTNPAETLEANQMFLSINDISTAAKNPNEGNNLKMEAFTYAMYRNFVPETAYPEKDLIDYINGITECRTLSNEKEKSNCVNQFNQTQKKLVPIVEGNDKASTVPVSSLADILIKGCKSRQNQELCNQFKAPALRLIIVKKDGEKDIYAGALSKSVSGKEYNYFGSDFDGSLASSQNLINDMLKSTNPLSWNGPTGNPWSKLESRNGAKLLIPNFYKYLSILTKTDEANINDAIRCLAVYNSYMTTNAIIDGMITVSRQIDLKSSSGSLKGQSKKDGDNQNKKSENFSNKLTATKLNIRSSFEEEDINCTTKAGLDNFFEKLELNIKKNALEKSKSNR